MGQTILTLKQQNFLLLFAKQKDFNQKFYLTGGTALSEYYLHHRDSDDLDFFCEEEIDFSTVQAFLKSIQKNLGFTKVDYQSSFNRNLAYLYFPKNYILKTEFTYFPFPQIEKPLKTAGFKIDSLLDIAVNKLFTIYQKPRIRDFIDLYLILQQKKWTIEELIKKAKVKFDWHIDFLQLGAQFLEVKTLFKIDYPKMIIKLDNQVLKNFFLKEAVKFREKIIKL